jgi:hypothetical protein
MNTYYPKMPQPQQRNPYFEALLKEGTNTSPIGAHSQGMSRLAFALLAGLERGEMDRRERAASLQQPRAQQGTSAAGSPSALATTPQPHGSSDAWYRTAAMPLSTPPSPTPVPYLPSQSGTPSDFSSRWPSENAFGSKLPDWFNFGRGT